jgi:hypothetical protein
MWQVDFGVQRKDISAQQAPTLKRAAQVGGRPGIALLLCYRSSAARSEGELLARQRLQNVTAALQSMGARNVDGGSENFCRTMSRAAGVSDATVQIFNTIFLEAGR